VQTTRSGFVYRVSSVVPSGRVVRVACVNSMEREVVAGRLANVYATRLVSGGRRRARRLSGDIVYEEDLKADSGCAMRCEVVNTL
jgi:hypothetical protein